MLDGFMRKLIDPPLDRSGHGHRPAAGSPPTPSRLFGLVLGRLRRRRHRRLGAPLGALALIALSRLARRSRRRGGAGDRQDRFRRLFRHRRRFRLLRAMVPLGFAVWLPARRTPCRPLSLLVTFYVNGASFLGYAVLAERHGLSTRARGVEVALFHRRPARRHRDHRPVRRRLPVARPVSGAWLAVRRGNALSPPPAGSSSPSGSLRRRRHA